MVGRRTTTPRSAGVWATPAIADGMVYVATNGGRLLGIDADDGKVRWQKKLPGPTWQSPVVVDGVLLAGRLQRRAARLRRPQAGVEPKELWKVKLGGCIESTPAVWKGRIYVGTRAGRFFAIGDRLEPEVGAAVAPASGGEPILGTGPSVRNRKPLSQRCLGRK